MFGYKLFVKKVFFFWLGFLWVFCKKNVRFVNLIIFWVVCILYWDIDKYNFGWLGYLNLVRIRGGCGMNGLELLLISYNMENIIRFV